MVVCKCSALAVVDMLHQDTSFTICKMSHACRTEDCGGLSLEYIRRWQSEWVRATPLHSMLLPISTPTCPNQQSNHLQRRHFGVWSHEQTRKMASNFPRGPRDTITYLGNCQIIDDISDKIKNKHSAPWMSWKPLESMFCADKIEILNTALICWYLLML